MITLIQIAKKSTGTGTSISLSGIDLSVFTPADIATYITMQSGDVLVRSEDNTTVATYHDQNGIKKVCRISGSAYLIRQ
jgi:hypothetical protein